jgi:hypothetical protein
LAASAREGKGERDYVLLDKWSVKMRHNYSKGEVVVLKCVRVSLRVSSRRVGEGAATTH